MYPERRKWRKVIKVNLVGSKGGIQEVTGGTIIVPDKSFFGVKEVYDENSR